MTSLNTPPSNIELIQNRRILVVEDSGFQAAEVEDLLVYAGAAVIGPVATLDGAQALLDSVYLDAAILDINLGGVRVDPLAEHLELKIIPFIFLSGSEREPVHLARFQTIPCVEKPIREEILLRELAKLF